MEFGVILLLWGSCLLVKSGKCLILLYLGNHLDDVLLLVTAIVVVPKSLESESSTDVTSIVNKEFT